MAVRNPELERIRIEPRVDVNDELLAQMREHMERAERDRMREYDRRHRGRYESREHEAYYRMEETFQNMTRLLDERFEALARTMQELVIQNTNLQDKVQSLEDEIKELSFYDEESTPEAA